MHGVVKVVVQIQKKEIYQSNATDHGRHPGYPAIEEAW
jgi:hypothetical protein